MSATCPRDMSTYSQKTSATSACITLTFTLSFTPLSFTRLKFSLRSSHIFPVIPQSLKMRANLAVEKSMKAQYAAAGEGLFALTSILLCR